MGLNLSKLKYFEYAYLVEAVIVVAIENKTADDLYGRAATGATRPPAKADSDDWTRCSRLRRRLTSRVRKFWAISAKQPPHRFPWSADAVCDWYMKCRKRTDVELAAYRQTIVRLKEKRGL